MADFDEDDDLDVFEEATDNADALTSGIVITTTVLLLGSIIVVMMALEKFYAVGPMAG